jgi:tetratricopeptide (TPR) repeat protein
VALEVPATNEKHWWLSLRRLLQHATRQAFFILDAKVDVDGLYWVFHNLGTLYSNQGKLAEAEKMYLRALEGIEKALGPDHTSTLDTIHNPRPSTGFHVVLVERDVTPTATGFAIMAYTPA